MIVKHTALPYFDEYFEGKEYKDEFGCHPEWNEHFNVLLSEFKSLDGKRYEQWKNRILREKERDAFLAELHALHLIHTIHGLKIVEIEPVRVGSHALEFSFTDPKGVLWYTEVKHPAWDGEVERNTLMSREEKYARKEKPQFITGDGHWFSAGEALADPIKNAVPKFRKGDNNLLVVVPNMFGGIGWIPYVEQTVIDELHGGDPQGLISTVIILEPRLMAHKTTIDYEPYKLVGVEKTPYFK